jgi:hypothetical protein
MSIHVMNGRYHELGIDLNSQRQLPAECFDVTYENCVLELYERNGSSDSDFIAIVWDEEHQETREVEYATTRGWTYLNGATVDATPEVRAKADAYWKARNRRTLEGIERGKLAKPHVGCRVRVARGRKVAPGFEGTVLHVSERVNAYSRRGRAETWALISNDSGAHLIPARHLDVLPDPEAAERQVAAALERFDRTYRHANYRSAAAFVLQFIPREAWAA